MEVLWRAGSIEKGDEIFYLRGIGERRNAREARCGVVQRRGRTDGVLVIPEDGCFVGWAAYMSE